MKGVTEVHVTRVSQDKSEDYQEWMEKIHRIESKFPGFIKVYAQPPAKPGECWITFLQFDSQENLRRWRNSAERKALLEETKEFVEAHESHELHSSFDGWFDRDLSVIPPLWKQTLLVLLVLYPVVMLEYKYLSPMTAGLNLSLATFIGNAISVSLISWPLMPLAIYLLGWWLKPNPSVSIQLLGVGCVIALYFLAIFLFWN